MEKLPFIHEINAFWCAISIHRWKTVLLLQQCKYCRTTDVQHGGKKVYKEHCGRHSNNDGDAVRWGKARGSTKGKLAQVCH